MPKMTQYFSLALILPFFPLLPPVESKGAPISAASISWLSSQSASDGALASIRRNDRASRDSSGKLPRLAATEHLKRANIYMSNRAFAEAREHWQALVDYYPDDPLVSEAGLGIGRSHLQQRSYQQAHLVLDQNAQAYPNTKAGRESLNFSASALLRMGNASEAVARYIAYTERYPNGERIETAHLNVIDSLREAGRPDEANTWVTRTRQKFVGTATDTNALFARLRLEVAESRWQQAVATADELIKHPFHRGIYTSRAEVAYLRAYSLEQAKNRSAAFTAYIAIPDSIDSYYGWLASERLLKLADAKQREIVNERVARVRAQVARAAGTYPAPNRYAILKAANPRKLDARFILAIIRQESVFRPRAKSPAGARGLLQLTIDAAERYAPNAGIKGLRETDLYHPETSIILGSEYLADLLRMFPGNLEAAAASYNGGEDNIARWIKRAKHQDPGVFTAEIGFDETKGYVQKVMANYRAYRELYNPNLVLK